MKMNYALVLGLCLTTSLIAQTNSTTPAAKKPASAKPAPAKTIVEPTVSLVPGPATVNATRVMLRARSTIMGERLGRFNKGDTVIVLEQVENKWAKGSDPKQWARIQVPAGTPVWVFAQFIGSDGTVTANRVNLRGGPGENYSILGRLPKGSTVKPVQTKGEWTQIEVPEVATAYIAAMYLKQDATTVAKVEPATNAVPVLEPASSTNTITDVEPVIAATTVDVGNTNASSATNDLTAFLQQMAAGEVEEPEDPAKPRIVMREGIVFNATSIQAPSHYSLLGLETGRNINYLHTTSTNVNLNRYNGKHVIVTGEESLDKRWRNTPVLTLQRIQVVDDE
jgi:uncharacterized protein YgiM (DUF1202 family)